MGFVYHKIVRIEVTDVRRGFMPYYLIAGIPADTGMCDICDYPFKMLDITHLAFCVPPEKNKLICDVCAAAAVAAGAIDHVKPREENI